MSDENKEIMRRWFREVWNEGRIETIDELYAEDCIAHGLNDTEGNPFRGPEGFKTFFKTFHGAFPDIKIEIEEIIAEGDQVMGRCRVRGTHTGDTLGFPATSLPIDVGGITFSRMKDGKIVEGWNYYDFVGLYQQLRAINIKGMQL